MASVRNATLAHSLVPGGLGTDRAGVLRALAPVALVLAGVALMVLSAKVKVPFFPVPMTLQTLCVLAIGAAYGSRLGALTVAAYVGLGLAGLPVFTNTPPLAAGPLYLLGPTGGFVAGFVPAAFLMGLAAERGFDRSVPKMFAAALAADALIFALGFLWLAFFAQLAGGATGLGAAAAFSKGVMPFVPGDLVKAALVALAFPAVWALVRRSETL